MIESSVQCACLASAWVEYIRASTYISSHDAKSRDNSLTILYMSRRTLHFFRFNFRYHSISCITVPTRPTHTLSRQVRARTQPAMLRVQGRHDARAKKNYPLCTYTHHVSFHKYWATYLRRKLFDDRRTRLGRE